MPLQRLDSLSEIAPQAWDALVPQAQPFVRPVSYTHLTLPTILRV